MIIIPVAADYWNQPRYPLELHPNDLAIAQMTICDYHMVMKQTGIADLKARLSEYLRAVRRGDTVTILDRETPVARIVPVHGAGLHVRKPAADAPPPNRVPLPPPANLPIDVLELLLEERQGQR
ncbi:MAG: hypothetical protein DMG70_01085 [Acidobacteria bacterium]|nr:MAG: hypothetical protein DMG70_01085 [Acidobacteriota bacterium]